MLGCFLLSGWYLYLEDGKISEFDGVLYSYAGSKSLSLALGVFPLGLLQYSFLRHRERQRAPVTVGSVSPVPVSLLSVAEGPLEIPQGNVTQRIGESSLNSVTEGGSFV